jgi:hypothetical protein
MRRARRSTGKPARPRAPAARPPLSFPDGGRASIPEADRFPPGFSRADAERVLAIRAGFLVALASDPRVAATFARFVTAAARPGARRRPPSIGLVELVRELELPAAWRIWVGVGLDHVFHEWLTRPIGAPARIPVGEVGVLAPPMERRWVIEPGEHVGEVRDRITAFVAEIEAELGKAERETEGERAGRRTARTDLAYLYDWGRWLYARRIRRPPMTVWALARADHDDRGAAGGHPGSFEDHDCRTRIRDGLRTAAELLARAAAK